MKFHHLINIVLFLKLYPSTLASADVAKPLTIAIAGKNSFILMPDRALENWAVVVNEFKLLGETDVKNVKITWEQRIDADYYKIFRNGKLIGETKGDTFDDYGLQVDKLYSYHAEAFKTGKKTATAIAAVARTFSPIGKGVLLDNSRGGNNLNQRGGTKIGEFYYSYQVKKVNKINNGQPTEGRAIYEKTSANGFDSWTERELAFYPNSNFECVAVVYNKKTKKFVVAAHYEDQGGYVAAKLYLAEIIPNGQLKVGFCGRPLGYDSRDQSVFVDDDGSAYILSATRNNNDIHIYKLDEAWSKPASLVKTLFIGEHRETPSIEKKNGEYYFFSSKASGWYPSQTMYASSLKLDGLWSSLKEIGNNSTFGTQANHTGKLGTERETYIMWSYRWGAQYKYKEPEGNYPKLLSVAFNAGFAAMEYYPYLEYHDRYGIIPIQAGKNLTLGATVTSTSASEAHGDTRVLTDGADLNSSGYFTGGSCPYSLTIDMNKKAQINEINLSTKLVGGSETAYKYTIEGSLDGKSYTRIFDGSNNWKVGFQILKIEDRALYRYLRLNVKNVVNIHNGNSALWADGIFEFVAFGERK